MRILAWAADTWASVVAVNPSNFCWADDSAVWAAATWSCNCWTWVGCPPVCSWASVAWSAVSLAWSAARRASTADVSWVASTWPACTTSPTCTEMALTVPVVGMLSCASSVGSTTPAADRGLDSSRSLTAVPSTTIAPTTRAPTTTPRAPRRRLRWGLRGANLPPSPGGAVGGGSVVVVTVRGAAVGVAPGAAVGAAPCGVDVMTAPGPDGGRVAAVPGSRWSDAAVAPAAAAAPLATAAPSAAVPVVALVAAPTADPTPAPTTAPAAMTPTPAGP